MGRRKAWIVAGVALGLARAQAPTSVRDGIYSVDQARRGESLFRQECASCHGEKLEGRGQAPPLTGDDFVMDWNGMTVDDLFERMKTSMPADRPGHLSREQNAMVLAYILSSNRYPSGSADLPAEADRLRLIRFEAAQGK